MIAAGLAIMLGQIVTVLINRWSVIINHVAQGGTKVVTSTQAAADTLPNNPDVVGPAEAKVVKP